MPAGLIKIKKWEEEKTNKKTNVRGFIVLDDGRKIDVDGNLRRYWNISARRERYQEDKKRRFFQCSLDAIGYSPKYIECELYASLSPAEDKVMDMLRSSMLRETLARLPPKEREAIEALYFKELSVTEAAKLIGCKRDTVRDRERRGIKRMRQMLSEYGIKDT